MRGIKKLTGQMDLSTVYTDYGFNKKEIKDYFKSKSIRLSSIVSKEEHISKGNRLGIIDTATRTI